MFASTAHPHHPKDSRLSHPPRRSQRPQLRLGRPVPPGDGIAQRPAARLSLSLDASQGKQRPPQRVDEPRVAGPLRARAELA
eukprot:9477841-Pyramimonas_sp.AAC.1